MAAGLTGNGTCGRHDTSGGDCDGSGRAAWGGVPSRGELVEDALRDPEAPREAAAGRGGIVFDDRLVLAEALAGKPQPDSREARDDRRRWMRLTVHRDAAHARAWREQHTCIDGRARLATHIRQHERLSGDRRRPCHIQQHRRAHGCIQRLELEHRRRAAVQHQRGVLPGLPCAVQRVPRPDTAPSARATMTPAPSRPMEPSSGTRASSRRPFGLKRKMNPRVPTIADVPSILPMAGSPRIGRVWRSNSLFVGRPVDPPAEPAAILLGEAP